jgi:hypothetical protein
MRSRISRVAVLALVLGALVLTACVRFGSFPRPLILSYKPAFILEDRLRTLSEDVPGGWGTVQTVPVGWHLWVRLDPNPSAPVIRYVASKLDVVSKPTTGFYDAGLHQARYALTVKIEGGGQDRQLQTAGVGRSGLSSPVAAFTAVDEAMVKLYWQLATLR